MDGGAWWARVHGATESDTTEHTCTSVRSTSNKLYLKLASEMGRSGLAE